MTRTDHAPRGVGGASQGCGWGLRQPSLLQNESSEDLVVCRSSPAVSSVCDVCEGGDEISGRTHDSVGPVVSVRAPTFALSKAKPSLVRAPAVSYEGHRGSRARGWNESVRLSAAAETLADISRLGIPPRRCALVRGRRGRARRCWRRAVAAESRVHFIHLNGPEIMRKFYGESEAKLREVFEEAARHAPAILFIDEIDAVAPKRAEVTGEVEKRVVAQLLSLMDGFVSRGQVIVIGATNIPEVLDPALRRPGRFDREMKLASETQARLPDSQDPYRASRSDRCSLDESRRIRTLVGRSRSACQEVGMIALRRFLSTAPSARPADTAMAARSRATLWASAIWRRCR